MICRSGSIDPRVAIDAPNGVCEGHPMHLLNVDDDCWMWRSGNPGRSFYMSNSSVVIENKHKNKRPRHLGASAPFGQQTFASKWKHAVWATIWHAAHRRFSPNFSQSFSPK
jgi:hypothetical protein